jgi:HEAT repeat protein
MRGEMHLYLDGLNEMGAQGSQKAKELRDWLESDNSPKHIVVTCREADYINDLHLGIPVVAIEEMDKSLVYELAQQYLQNDAARFLAKVLHTWEYLPSERQLFHLASNPFRLMALMFVFRISPEGDLPRNNGALMRKLAQVLWKRERQIQTPGWISFEEMEKKFGKLAFDMINEDRPTEVSERFALKRLENVQLLNAGRSANLIVTKNHQVHFYHQLIQEYFAAIWIMHLGVDGQVQPFERFIGGRVPNKFDQVFIALTGIVENRDATVSYIATQDVYLATACIGSGVEISEENRSQIITEAMTHNDEWIRCNAIKVLREIADPLTIPLLINALNDNGRDLRPGGDYVMSEAEKSLERIGQATVPYLIEALNNENAWIRGRAVRLLGKFQVKGISSKIIALLGDRENIQFGMPQFVYDVAVDALIQIGDTDTVSLLMNILNDVNPLIRWNAVRTLGQFSDPITIPILIAKLSDKSKPDVATYYESLYGSLYICDAAAAALEHIGIPEALEAVERWRREQNNSQD